MIRRVQELGYYIYLEVMLLALQYCKHLQSGRRRLYSFGLLGKKAYEWNFKTEEKRPLFAKGRRGRNYDKSIILSVYFCVSS